MRDGISVTLVGGRQLKAQLRRLGDALAGQVLENAAAAGGLLVANRWKELARFRTGTYRRSIHVGGHERLTPDFTAGERDYGPIGGNRHSRVDAEVHVGTDVPYGPRLEYGFVGRDKLGRYYNQLGDGAGRRAFDETRDDVVDEVGEAVKDQLRRAVRG